jgi:parallel beta-helix repeat protein
MHDEAKGTGSTIVSTSVSADDVQKARTARRNMLALIGAGLGLGATQALAACSEGGSFDGLATTSQPVNKALSVHESETYGDLRALNGGFDVVFVRGRETPADGGEGFFAWVPGDTLDDDDGTIIRPEADAAIPQGNWRRIYDGPINVRWFGAKGNAQNAGDGAAIQAAIDAAVTPLSGPAFTRTPAVYIPVGVYRCPGTLTLKRGCRLTGDSMDASVLEWDGDLMTGAGSAVDCSDAGPGTNTGGIFVDQGEAVIENLTLRPYYTTNGYSVAEGQPEFAPRSGPIGVWLHTASYCTVRDCTFDSWSYGIVLDIAHGTRIERCSFKDNRESAVPQPVPTHPSQCRTVGILIAPTHDRNLLDPEYPDLLSSNCTDPAKSNCVQIIGGYMAAPHIGIWHHGAVDHLVEGMLFNTSFVHVLLMGGQKVEYRNNYHEGGHRVFLGRNRTSLTDPQFIDCVTDLTIDDYYGGGTSAPVLFVEAGSNIGGTLRFAGFSGSQETVPTGAGPQPGSVLFFEPGYGGRIPADIGALDCTTTSVGGISRRLINVTPKGTPNFASLGPLYISRPIFRGAQGACAVQLVPLRSVGAPLVLLSQRLKQAPLGPPDTTTTTTLTPIVVTIPENATVAATAKFVAHVNPSKMCAVYVRRMLASRVASSVEQTPFPDMEALGPVSIPVKPQIVKVGNNLEFRVSITKPFAGNHLLWQVLVELTVCDDAISNAREMSDDVEQLRWDGAVVIPSRA